MLSRNLDLPKKKILSIITAPPGLLAFYKQDVGSSVKSAVLALALVESTEMDGHVERFVTGLDGGEFIDFCEDNSNFEGYDIEHD